MSPATVALWETGKRNPPGPALKLIWMYLQAANEIQISSYGNRGHSAYFWCKTLRVKYKHLVK
nr:hypothetical protein CKG001_32080 [Bdellovibrio sp. CKG001]